jgi:hypothetical protein
MADGLYQRVGRRATGIDEEALLACLAPSQSQSQAAKIDGTVERVEIIGAVVGEQQCGIGSGSYPVPTEIEDQEVVSIGVAAFEQMLDSQACVGGVRLDNGETLGRIRRVDERRRRCFRQQQGHACERLGRVTELGHKPGSKHARRDWRRSQLLHAVMVSRARFRSPIEVWIGADADHQRVRRRSCHGGLVDQKRFWHLRLRPTPR